MALRDAVDAAAQAAQSLQQQNTGPVTQGHQQEVLDTLTRMLDVLRDEQPPPQEPDETRQPIRMPPPPRTIRPPATSSCSCSSS